MAVIAVGGFQHETNTFAPSKADYHAFEEGGGWPGVQLGDALAAAVEGANIPAAGALAALRALGHRTAGLAWAAASPSAHVTREAYERIAGEIVGRLAAAGPVDGVYLDLHGAMVAEHLDDGEGELLARVRRVVGERVPVVASLDLHANVTRAMVERADGLVAYRTYPHVDMAETGARAARLLDAMLRAGRAPARSCATLDYLTGIPSQCTFMAPAKDLYASLAALEAKHGVTLSFTPGFPMADFPECGMAVFGYGDDAAQVEAATRALAGEVADAEPDFALELFAPDEAVRRAIQRGEAGRPVVLADTQDNPGAGGNGDTTGLLRALLHHRAQGAVLGLLIDPAAARRAHEVGTGGTARFSLGEISGVPGTIPLTGEFRVERLGDGHFTCTGPMFRGFRMHLGPMALLASREAPGVRVVLASVKCQAADQEMFRHVGVEPRAERIVAVKSSVHFRADFEPIAKEVLVVKAPGPALADPAEFRWTRLRKGVRLRPLGPAFAG
ncbi:MAG: M81 family metallopeptidase [Burkholderiales bacterium]|nr:M81 family metallopeptidase [Burkholderiales bacterium]